MGILETLRRVHGWLIVLCALALMSSVAPVLADDQPATPSSPRQSSPVIVANRRIVVLRGPIAGYSASERAASSMRRILEALDSQAKPAITIADAEEGRATRVMIGDTPAFLITAIDIDTQAGETTRIVAREAARRLEEAAVAWREQRTPRYLAVATALAVGATLAFAGVVLGLRRASIWVGARLSVAAAARATAVSVGGVRLLNVAQVLLLTRRVLAVIAWGIGLVLATGWLTFVLAQYPYTRPWADRLEGSLLRLITRVVLAIAEAMPGLLLVVVIGLLARVVIRTAAVFFDRIEAGAVTSRWLDEETARPTRRIFNALVALFALAMAYPYLPGANTEAFKGLSVLVGVMVTFGGASIVGQAFSGLVLMYIRAFRTGDYVRIGEIEGTVTVFGMFATKIRTGLGAEITLPNSGIMATTTKNYSRAVSGTGYVMDTAVTIGYDAPWRQVHAILDEAAQRTRDVSPTPPPMVRQTALSDYYVEYRLIAHTPLEQPDARADVLNRLHANIQDVFNEYGVQIMSPHYMMDPAAPKIVPRRGWAPPPAKPSPDDR